MQSKSSIYLSIAFLVIVFCMGVLFWNELESKNRTNQNAAYIRAIACIVATPATTRTQADIDKCYENIEQDTGFNLAKDFQNL